MDLDKIYLGDAYKLIKQVPDKSIDLIVTDPPYQFRSGSGGGAFGTKKRSHEELEVALKSPSTINNPSVRRKIKNRFEISDISSGFDNSILDECCRVMKKINIYVWCSKNQLRQLIDYFDDKGCNIDLLTWHKENPLPTCNNTYLNDTEYCVFAREKGVRVYGRFETKRKYFVTCTNVRDKKLYHHPTIKPLDIIETLIYNSTQERERETILDPFIGSGTTAVASKRLGKHFIGFELNPNYYEIAIDRLNNVTQIDKKKEEEGQLSLF